MSDKNLIQDALYHLNHMTRYSHIASQEENLNEETLYEAAADDEIPEGMPKNIHDFLFHLSGPSDPTGKGKISLDEATLFDIKRGDKPGAISPPSDLAHKNMGMPKTAAMINKAKEEGLGKDNLHKAIGAGFRKAFDELETEHPKDTKSKLKEARGVFKEFAKSRGLKATSVPSLTGGNMKTEKSTGEGVKTTGLNLAPHATAGLHGFDTCPRSSADCRKNCLGTEAGGNRQYPDTAMSSKVLRTHFVAAHPEHAARILDHEITQHKAAAKKEGMVPGVRLNVTSDLSWEHHAPKMFERHKDVQFYDYTKIHNRVLKSIAPKKEGSHFNEMGHPSNYHLTLSHTGTGHDESNDKQSSEVLKKGGVVAMVFQRGKKGRGLPTHVMDHSTGHKYPVVNGDDDDNTFDRHATAGRTEGKEHHGVISGLMLKGVKNEHAGAFANSVDENGVAHINKPKTVSEEKKNIMISFRKHIDAKRLAPTRSGSKGGAADGSE